MLKGDEDMRRLTGVQAGLLGCAVLASGIAGLVLAAEAVAETARGSARVVPQDSGRPNAAAPPSSYVQHLLGAPVTIAHRMTGDGYVFPAARVRNVSENQVVELRFVALIPDRLGAKPVRVVESGPIGVSLGPGQAADVKLNLLPVEAVDTRRPMLGPMLSLLAVRFGNGERWAVRVDRTARNTLDALYVERASVAKALVGAAAPEGSGDTCLDHKGLAYSRGAVVPVFDGPPQWAICDNGAWKAFGRDGSPSTHQ